MYSPKCIEIFTAQFWSLFFHVNILLGLFVEHVPNTGWVAGRALSNYIINILHRCVLLKKLDSAQLMRSDFDGNILISCLL